MAELPLLSSSQRPLPPLVAGALQNAWRLLEAGSRRGEQRRQEFAARAGLSTAEFGQRYENEAREDTLDCAAWIGAYRVRERLLEKAAVLRAMRFADGSVFSAAPRPGGGLCGGAVCEQNR